MPKSCVRKQIGEFRSNSCPLNNRGFFHVKTVLILLAAAGVWFMWHSYKNGSLSQDMGHMLTDCQRAMRTQALSDQDKEQLDQAFARIREISSRNNLNLSLPVSQR